MASATAISEISQRPVSPISPRKVAPANGTQSVPAEREAQPVEGAVSEMCTVKSRSGRTARVTSAGGDREAEIAPGCLVSPAPGDRVLVVRSGDEAYVLSVLRRGEGETQLIFDRDVSLSVLKGRLRILSQEGVDLVSPGALDLKVGSLSTVADQARVAFSALEMVGRSITSKATKIRFVAEALDTIASRVYQRAVHSLRRTEELDRVEAKNVDVRAEGLLHVHGENAVTTADHLVKIDAGQVHVG